MKKVLAVILGLLGLGGIISPLQAGQLTTVEGMEMLVGAAFLYGAYHLFTSDKKAKEFAEENGISIKKAKEKAKIEKRRAYAEKYEAERQDKAQKEEKSRLDEIRKEMQITAVAELDNVDQMVMVEPNMGQSRTILQVDDDAKVFALNKKVYPYDKLREFEYVEDGETVISGNTLATVAGGLAFGFLGAMAGQAKSKKVKKKVKAKDIVIHINDLKNPIYKVSITTNQDVDRDVELFLTTLSYIKNQA